MKKKLITIMTAAFAVATLFSMTAFGYDKTAGWNWINGYCYYYTDVDHQNLLKSCITPDGYTVDDQGRWTENGVPQHNGYGTKVMGTDQLYAGLDDAGIIHTMIEKMDEIYRNYGGTFSGSWNSQMYTKFSCLMSGGDRPFLCFTTNVWNDSPECSVSNRSEFYEQAIKLLVGDHVGQELFDQIRAAAEPNVAGGVVPYRDENGNFVEYIDEYGFHCIKTVSTATKGNGVNFNLFNWQAWNGRKTDYGKTIEFDFYGNDATHPDQWVLIVK